jgi:ribonuclease HII
MGSLIHFYTDNKIEIGVDEVGRGPLFGRVYVAAVILPKNDFDYHKLKDSKRFSSKKKIKEVSDYIKEKSIIWSIQYEDENVIDSVNILQATQQAMHKCIKDIMKNIKEKNEDILLLIDGNYFKPLYQYNKELDKIEEVSHVCIEKGDNTYCSIAAASILAKVARDEYILELCNEYPDLIEKYNIQSNKGYGSSIHLDGIKKYGITSWHRKTFGICKNYNT